jgi:N-acetylglutamate synthase-like GNAT family acetyltransferase
MLLIRKIAAKATYEVRHKVLRKGKPITSCIFDGDDLSTTYHYGLYENKTIIGVISIYKNSNNLFIEENQLQLRGMAILDNYQQKGLGKRLVEYIENEIKNTETNLIWFNARKNAVGFYEKIGFSIMGTPFEIKDVGQHYVMYKVLRSR